MTFLIYKIIHLRNRMTEKQLVVFTKEKKRNESIKKHRESIEELAGFLAMDASFLNPTLYNETYVNPTVKKLYDLTHHEYHCHTVSP